MSEGKPVDPGPADLLPLRDNWLHILVSLAAGPRHGYGIMTEVIERTEGSVRLWPATLYNTLKQLLDEELIEESDELPRPDEDQRRRYYRLSSRGEEVLEAELARLEALVATARARRRPRESEGSR